MKTKKITYVIANLIVIMFAIVGAFFASIVVHEYSHAKDFRKLNEVGEVAIYIPHNLHELVFGYGGSYELKFLDTEENRILERKIDSFTEIKAYTMSALTLIALAISVIIITENRFINEKPSISRHESRDSTRGK